MKGLTHNLLACLKCSSYPLRVTADEADQLDCDFDIEHVRRMMPKLDWAGLLSFEKDLKAAYPKEFEEAGVEALPTEQPIDIHTNEPALQTVHYLTNVLRIVNGSLQCPSEKCGQKFPIKETIPNMVLNEL